MTPTAADPLAALRPIVLPAEPGWWPPAPGWWLLLAALIGLVLGLVLWLRHRRQRGAPLRMALQTLNELSRKPGQTGLPDQLNQLLRRAARHSHGGGAAAQAPRAWAQFLASTAPPDLRNAPWEELAQAAYRPPASNRAGEFIGISRAWLRHNLPC